MLLSSGRKQVYHLASWETGFLEPGFLGNCLTLKKETQETKFNLIPYWLLQGKWHPEILTRKPNKFGYNLASLIFCNSKFQKYWMIAWGLVKGHDTTVWGKVVSLNMRRKYLRLFFFSEKEAVPKIWLFSNPLG